MRVLVTGWSGNVGSSVLSSLRSLGVDARSGGRPGGTTVPDVALDFEDPATWPAALEGVTALFLLRPPAISDVGPTLNAFVDAGRGQLDHVVFLSVAGADRNTFIPHAKVERHLRACGIPWTFLRAGFFSQNLVGPYRRDIREDDRLYVPAGHRPVAWTDTRDVGEAAARAFLDPDARNAAWTLTGGETQTFDQVADLLSTHLERPIHYAAASLFGYLWHLRSRRKLDWAPALVFAVLHTAIRFGAESRTDPTLREVLGRSPRTIEDTIRDDLAVWQR